MYFTCSRAWRIRVLYELVVFTYLACILKMARLACLCVCAHETLVNCRFWIRSDIFNGRQEIAKPIITIFMHIYRIQKQISWLPNINLKFSLPISSNKLKFFLKSEGSFDIFIKLYSQIEQVFNACGEIHAKLKPRWKLFLILRDAK